MSKEKTLSVMKLMAFLPEEKRMEFLAHSFQESVYMDIFAAAVAATVSEHRDHDCDLKHPAEAIELYAGIIHVAAEKRIKEAFGDVYKENNIEFYKPDKEPSDVNTRTREAILKEMRETIDEHD